MILMFSDDIIYNFVNSNRLSYWRFSTFTSCNLRRWAFLPNGSQACVDPTSPNLAWT